MATRRYFKSTILELEQLFESSKRDHTVLNDLRDELSHRDRPRAVALAKKVDEQLAGLGQTKPATEPTISKPATSITRGQQGSSPAPRAASNATVSPPTTSNSSPATAPIERELRVPTKLPKHADPVEFGDATPYFAPEIETKPGPDSALAAWLTLEVLTPQALPDARELETIGRTLVRLDEHPAALQERMFGSEVRNVLSIGCCIPESLTSQVQTAQTPRVYLLM